VNFRPRREDKPELNLIPMIDVLIVLLIFLVLTTTFSREAALHIRLPEAAAPDHAEEKGLEVVIDAEGRYVIDRHQVVNDQTDTLKRALLAAAADNKDPLVIISADEKTPHGAVVKALDAASQLGFVHISIATKSVADGNP
jgi:biopolymer transport protein ExbD